MMFKKTIVLTLGVLLLNSTTEFHELLKIPLLIEHYMHHRTENTSISFLAFLKIHYTDTQHPNDNDDREDNGLPFKSIGNISHIDTPIMQKAATLDYNLFIKEKSPDYYPEGFLSHRSFAIFHPPRMM